MSLNLQNMNIRKVASYSGVKTLEEIRTWLIPEEEVSGKGIVRIGERRKPPYNASEEDIARAKENILKWMETRTSIGGLNIEDVQTVCWKEKVI